jgi:hypothetical protein
MLPLWAVELLKIETLLQLQYINSLSYTKSFGNHNFNALAIQEAYKFELDQLGSQERGFYQVYVLVAVQLHLTSRVQLQKKEFQVT